MALESDHLCTVCVSRQVNARLKAGIGKTSMLNYRHFMHGIRFFVRGHNAECNEKIARLQELKRRANLA
jgi:hypothetical protein